MTTKLEQTLEQAAEPVATDDRCPKCGYLTCHTEHIGCLRDAVSAINAFARRNFAIVDVDTHPAPTQQAAEPVAWQPIETAPKDGRKVILFYLNRNTKARTVMARWLTDEEAAEADGDDVGLESGWYECIDNWDDYTEVAIHEGEPSHWMPLPKAPAAHGITGSKEGGAA